MGLFSKKEPEPVETGITILRKALKVRSKSPNAVARLLDGGTTSTNPHVGRVDGVNPAKLDAFLGGSDNLSVAQLNALAKVLFPYSEYDEATGLLRSVNHDKPPLFAGRPPEPYDQKRDNPNWRPVDRDAPFRTTKPGSPEPSGRPKPRPGFA